MKSYIRKFYIYAHTHTHTHIYILAQLNAEKQTGPIKKKNLNDPNKNFSQQRKLQRNLQSHTTLPANSPKNSRSK